jgi:hypothetical protein
MGQKPVMKNAPAQPDSGISNGRLSGESCWPHGHKTENAPAQPDSGISNGRLSDEFCLRQSEKPVLENAPAQPDSGISKLN